jgi:hypothetical protein
MDLLCPHAHADLPGYKRTTLDYALLFDRLDTLPATAQPLFPQADAVVASADSQYVAAQAPADAPGDRIDIENSGLPLACYQLVRFHDTGSGTRTKIRRRPDAHSLVL